MTKVLAKTRRKGPVVIICLTKDKPNALMGVSIKNWRLCPRQRHFLFGQKIIISRDSPCREARGRPQFGVDKSRDFYFGESMGTTNNRLNELEV